MATVTFTLVGNLADFGTDPRAGVQVKIVGTPRIKVDDGTIYSDEPETVTTDKKGAFTCALISTPGLWYQISTPFVRAINPVSVAAYIPDPDDPTTGVAFAAGVTVDLADVMDEDPAPGYDGVFLGGGGGVPAAHTHPASGISDSTATGRAVLTAATQDDARTAIGAGTSSFSGAYTDLTDKPTLGTAAATDTAAYATAAQGAKADGAAAHAAVLPAPNGTNDTTALQAVLTSNAGRAVVGRSGAAYKISAPLVVSSGTTLDMTGCTITLIAGSNCRMVQNAALSGSGARDTDIHIVGGYWDRGANAGATSNDTHSIVLHRADRVSVTDIRFTATGACKYAIYGVDVTRFRVERCDLTSTSDGVHVTGPASDITVRDIAGDSDDDLVSFTGRDYTNYEMTAGGGDLSGITVERITLRSGDGNAVKLLPGQSKTLSAATVRDVTGNPVNSAVVIFSDTLQAATTGGTVRDVLIDGVSGAPSAAGFMVNVAHPDVQNVTVRNVMVSSNASPRVVGLSTTGGTAKRVLIDGVVSTVAYTGSFVHVGGGYTVQELKVVNVAALSGAGTGSIVQVSGTIDNLQGSNIAQAGGRSVVTVDGAGLCPLLAVAGLASTATYGLFVNNAAASVECHLSNVTKLPTSRLVFANAGAAFLHGGGLVAATSHIGKSVGATIRATGGEVRADVSTLTPQDGDTVYNTAGTFTPVGVVTSDESRWKRAGVIDAFTRGMDFPSIAPGASESLSFARAGSGVVVGDDVRLVPPAALEAGLSWVAWVSSTENITVRLTNHTAAAVNPAPATWGFRIS